MRVGRRYFFRARHAVLGLPEPWCRVHAHDYTVEVVVDRPEGAIRLIDHEGLDAQAKTLIDHIGGENLNDIYEYTTVEALADEFLRFFEADEVTVWEDNDRWATATA